MDINSKKWYFDTRKDFFKQIMIYFQWNSSSVMNIDIQNQKNGKNYEKIGKKFKRMLKYFQWILSSVMNIDIQNQKFGKNYEKIGKKFKIKVLVPFPLICLYSY